MYLIQPLLLATTCSYLDTHEENEILTLLLIGTSGMILLVVSIVTFIIVYQKKLSQQKKQAQQDLLNASIQAQESERSRIASNLHDEVGSTLTTTKNYLTQLRFQTSLEGSQAVAEEAKSLLNHSIQHIRDLSKLLHPAILEQLGLASAVEELCNQSERANLTRVHFVQKGEEQRLPWEQELALYRILQELLNNSHKHAQATLIEIELIFQSQHLQIFYRDNGKGFDIRKVEKEANTGLGLKNMRNRADLIGAKMHCISSPNQGVEVVIDLNIS